MRNLYLLVILGLLLYPHLSYAEPMPPEEECPCDTGILEVICPNGMLAPGAEIIDNATALGVFLNDPMRQFATGINNQDDLACSFTQGDVDIEISGLDEAQLQSCRDDIINACGLLTRNIPTLSEWGLIAMAGILGLIGLFVIRRKRAAT